MRVAASAIVAIACASAVACSSDPPLEVVEVDLARFQGKWHEIAKLPRLTQADCEGTTAFYRLRSSTELDVTNECRQGDRIRSVAARALVTDTPAKLSLDVGGFYGDYWIIDVGEHYEFSVVGHPTRDYLWILSRTPTLEQGTLAGILDRALHKGFDVSRLEYTVQP